MSEKGLKKQKLEERIQNEINDFFRTGLSDSRLQFVSITSVKLNRDNSLAKVYWDTFDNRNRSGAIKAIDSAQGKIRTHLSKIIKMRQIPNLEFYYDSQFESEKAIEDILAEESKSGKSY